LSGWVIVKIEFGTYPVVATKVSILLVFAIKANVMEKIAVKAVIAPSLAPELFIKYNAKIEAIGSRDETMTLMTLVVLVIREWEYSKRPVSSSGAYFLASKSRSSSHKTVENLLDEVPCSVGPTIGERGVSS
jgi:hypothetical protein